MLVGAGAGVVLNLPAGAGASGAPSVATASTASTDNTGSTATTDGTETTAPTTDGSTSDGPTTPADDQAKAGRGEFLKTQLDALVADGTITQAQADAILAGIESSRPAAGTGDGNGTGGPGMGGRPGGHRGPGMGGGRGAGLGGALGVGIDAAATALGVTTAELKTELAAGKTIADVATEKGVDVQTVIDAIVASETAELTLRVTDAVNGVKPTRPAAPDDTATTTPSADDTTPTTTG